MIYTGRFSEVENYKRLGLTPVSIAGYAPKDYTGVQFKMLAPKYSWWKEWHGNHLSNDWYKTQYQETVLKKLNPEAIAKRLQSFGKNVILLCYEHPEEFCHRQLVAHWFRSAGTPAREYLIAHNLSQTR